MDGNKDEALKCLSIAQRYRDAANYSSARKFCKKSISLFATPEAARLLENIEELESAAGSSSSSSPPSSSMPNGKASDGEAYTSSAEPHPSAAGAKHRHTHASSSSTANGSTSEKRDYTPEQAAVVKRIRACKITEYYEILSVQKDCTENDVKKSYRKVRLRYLTQL